MKRWLSNQIHTTVPVVPVINCEEEVSCRMNLYRIFHDDYGDSTVIWDIFAESAVEYFQRYWPNASINYVKCLGEDVNEVMR